MQTAGTLTEIVSPPLAVDTGSNDKALVAAIAKRDRDAMQQLFARHSDRVYRFVLRLTGRETLAEDLVSEVFLEVWHRAERFEARAKVGTWLLAIARYKAIDALRKRQDGEIDDETLAQVEDPSDTPDVTMEKNDRAALLRDCLTRLSPVHREIIDLVYYHEKSIEEVAGIIGIPRATVKTRMFYARRQLGQMMRDVEAGRLLS